MGYLATPAFAGGSGQVALGVLHRLFGQALEDRKRKDMAPSNVGLGVLIDVARAHVNGIIYAMPSEGRVAKILGELYHAQAADYLSPVPQE